MICLYRFRCYSANWNLFWISGFSPGNDYTKQPGSIQTGRDEPMDREPAEKHACCFFFQVWHPDAMNAGAFALGRDQVANVKAVIADILGHALHDVAFLDDHALLTSLHSTI